MNRVPVSRYDVRNCISDYGRQVVALFIHIPDLYFRLSGVAEICGGSVLKAECHGIIGIERR